MLTAWPDRNELLVCRWKPVGSLAPTPLEFSSCTCSATLKLLFGKWFIWQLTKIIIQHFWLCCLSHLESYLHNGKNSLLNKEKGRDCQSSSDKCFQYELDCKCLWRCWAPLFGCWLTLSFLFLHLLFSQNLEGNVWIKKVFLKPKCFRFKPSLLTTWKGWLI